jgi:benzoylformate decarboxylase
LVREERAMAERTGRYAVLEQLACDGIVYIFGNPGTVEQGFLDAIREMPRIRYITGLQETVPLAIADGYARSTRKPAVVQLHSGVGLGNGIGMLYQSKRGHTPLVVVAGEAGVCYDAMDAQMACDLVAMAEPVTKWSTRVLDPSSVLRVLRRAIKIAATPPMGPVFVSLPMDVLDAPNNEEVVATVIPNTRTVPDTETMERLAKMLAGANRPMLIIGDGIAASGAHAELARVAEILGAEVWGANSSEVNIDACHPLFKGLLGHMFGSHSTPIVSQADALLIVGTYVFPEVFPSLSGVFKSGASVAHIDLNAYEIAKNFPVDLGIVADPKLTLAALAETLLSIMTPAQGRAAAARVQEMEDAKRKAIKEEMESDENARDTVPMKLARFAEELSRRLDEEAIIFDEALTCSPDLNRYLPARKPGHFFQTRGGSLGVGIPGAIGLKLAHPDKTVIGFTGDGGSMYTIQALWTAARYNIGSKFVICNNGSYELLKLNLQQYWRERSIPEHDFPASFDLALPELRFDRIAQSMGVPGVRVERPTEIGPALDEALSTDGPFLIDLVVTSIVPKQMTDCKCGQ